LEGWAAASSLNRSCRLKGQASKSSLPYRLHRQQAATKQVALTCRRRKRSERMISGPAAIRNSKQAHQQTMPLQ